MCLKMLRFHELVLASNQCVVASAAGLFCLWLAGSCLKRPRRARHQNNRRLRGINRRRRPPIEKSVSVLFRVLVVRVCVRAELCGCVREVSLNAGGPDGNKYDSRRGVVLLGFCCNLCSFSLFSWKVLLFVCVYFFPLCVYDGMSKGFLMIPQTGHY